MQVAVHRNRLVRKEHPTLVKANSSDTKMQCSQVNFDFQSWNAAGECDSLTQLSIMWKEGGRERDG